MPCGLNLHLTEAMLTKGQFLFLLCAQALAWFSAGVSVGVIWMVIWMVMR